MQHHNPPPDEPRGILFLLDPAWAPLIESEFRFEQSIEKAWRAGRLWLEETPSLH
jgi:hypothetical protein